MRHGSLFSGIGGFDLAAEWMGWQNIFHCEWEEFPKKILNHYWPEAVSYDDITKTDFTIHKGQIDILTGGFPCQPYSGAGKRLGKEDERHLWPEMLRAIKEIAPTYVVGENVSGLVNWSGGLVFDEVQADLEDAGFDVCTFILPACAVNAPHRRDRVWFVAYTGHKSGGSRERCKNKPRWELLQGKQQGCSVWGKGTGCCSQWPIAYTRSKRREGSKLNETFGAKKWQQSKPHDTIAQFCKIPPRPNWQNFPTQSPICNGNDGFSGRLAGITFPRWRNESIKALGNAVVPQVVYEIFKAIQTHNDSL